MRAESDFTPPSEWCPNPGRWTADDDEATEHEVTELVAAFVRALQPDMVVETGSYLGQTTEAIGHALASNGNGRCVSIETEPERVASARERCTGLPVEIVEGSSLDWLETNETPIGFAWLDSGPIRHDELRLVVPHLAVGAIVGIHDMAPQHAHHVSTLVDPVANEVGLVRLTLRTPRGAAFFQQQ